MVVRTKIKATHKCYFSQSPRIKYLIFLMQDEKNRRETITVTHC
ncbi:unnamed protein product, partial [Amoebophrya sp. A120]|eukprot:GSA120T00011778001.1